jgi:hypothetical protein
VGRDEQHLCRGPGGSAEDVVRLAAKLHVPRLPKTVVEAWDRLSDSHYRDGGENNS